MRKVSSTQGRSSAEDNFRTFLFSYNFDGERWGFEIKARGAEEAKARVERLLFARYDGELKLSVPADTKSLLAAIKRSLSAVGRRLW